MRVEVALDIVSHARLRLTMEAHGHGSIDSFGNVHMAAWVKSTYWTLADMMTIGEEAHHTCETVVEALVSNEQVFAVSEATLKQR